MTTPTRPLPTTADVVIVGAGSAGCVLAERLSRDPARSVLLCERGPARWPTEQTRDLRRLPIAEGADHAVTYAEDSGLAVIRGRGFGGSSVVNGGYFLRWHADDFARWPTGWGLTDIERCYDELDDTMSVSVFADDELTEVGRRFETHWATRLGARPLADRWPVVGVNRVRSNRIGALRMTAGEAYLRPALTRPNLTVCADVDVDAVAGTGRDVTGVVVGQHTVTAGEVILCAGTLGTAAILLRSDLDSVAPEGSLGLGEHREILVHYRSLATDPHPPVPLLQTVVHTPDDLEIRCYSADMADYIDGVPPLGPAIGVTSMRPGAPGTLRLAGRDLVVDLGDGDSEETPRIDAGVADVVEMLRAPVFGDLADADSVAVDQVLRNAQHAWGTMPMGERTDWLGGVYGLRGLRIVDGSILPTAGRSGPHATTMMVACRIGDALVS
ncbi:mycofactocin system GMC family oxidoreductase MftG [Gordonia sp. CPCC 205515]|uniref:mycofactocin system GMC family oxidoreductase MftG n=1 Tax=Gordonia sp. CPCC 205515 TaxID=3140791 RepID=UPI003AF39DAF